ncbi:succinate dehydrogenase flavoprotein subunit [Cutibacterium acnes JCM 18918]|nr:succinate dehydrogenase flavoprotein subunit [Cutibacterium acnes JCM 18918]
MQGLADGYWVLPNTITDYLADSPKFGMSMRSIRPRLKPVRLSRAVSTSC